MSHYFEKYQLANSMKNWFLNRQSFFWMYIVHVQLPRYWRKQLNELRHDWIHWHLPAKVSLSVFAYSSSNEQRITLIIMNFQILVFIALFSFNFCTYAKDSPHHREGKCIWLQTIHFCTVLKLYFFAVFSLFNIVTFKNEGCRSTSTSSR